MGKGGIFKNFGGPQLKCGPPRYVVFFFFTWDVTWIRFLWLWKVAWTEKHSWFKKHSVIHWLISKQGTSSRNNSVVYSNHLSAHNSYWMPAFCRDALPGQLVEIAQKVSSLLGSVRETLLNRISCASVPGVALLLLSSCQYCVSEGSTGSPSVSTWAFLPL